MGTLYIDRKDIHIKLDGNALAFYFNGRKEGIVPIAPLKRVIIVGNKVVDTAVFRKLADEKISVLFLSGRSMRFCGILHGRLHNNGLLRLKQYEKAINRDFCLHTAKAIIERKVKTQIDFLKNLITEESRSIEFIPAIDSLEKVMKSISEAPSIDSLRGFEGGAQAVYFSAYCKLFHQSLNFKGRNRRPPLDPVNAMLSLVYTMLHYEAVREIEITGFDPTIGFYHHFEYGRESLACDIIEIFRPLADKFVYEIFKNKYFTAEDFSHEERQAGCYLKKDSRKKFYPAYEEWASTIRPQLTEEVRVLARSILDGKEPLY
ncbi:MAG: CRISPR-associated endonuclease Cas1 [Thermodesulfovibrionales bacterium]|nr:CRISPR-associated endonuclease Cas1 [Thermodesulfovibrionales bacterium]